MVNDDPPEIDEEDEFGNMLDDAPTTAPHMRHESIETTLKYYVHRKATKTAKVIWEAYETIKSEKGSHALAIPSFQPLTIPIGNKKGNSRRVG